MCKLNISCLGLLVYFILSVLLDSQQHCRRMMMWWCVNPCILLFMLWFAHGKINPFLWKKPTCCIGIFNGSQILILSKSYILILAVKECLLPVRKKEHPSEQLHGSHIIFTRDITINAPILVCVARKTLWRVCYF